MYEHPHKPLPSLDVLQHLLRLDEENGHVYWRSRTLSDFNGSQRYFKMWNGLYAGTRALVAGGDTRHG